MTAAVITILMQQFQKTTVSHVVPPCDGDFIVGFDTVVIRYLEKNVASAKLEDLLENLFQAKQRNKKVVLIIEQSKQYVTKGSKYEKAVAHFLSIPWISVMFSTSDKETARLISVCLVF